MAVKMSSVVGEGRTRSINVRMMLATLPRIELMIYQHLMQFNCNFMAGISTQMTSQQKVEGVDPVCVQVQGRV